MRKRRAIRPDAQAFDEVRLVTVPRFKTSGLSGDEWRISVTAEYYRKGRLLKTESIAHKMEQAAAFLGHKYVLASESGAQYYGGEENFCDQEGCSKQATITLQLKAEYCRSGHRVEVEKDAIVFRKFCEEHKDRGDCALEDANDNYEKIEHIQERGK